MAGPAVEAINFSQVEVVGVLDGSDKSAAGEQVEGGVAEIRVAQAGSSGEGYFSESTLLQNRVVKANAQLTLGEHVGAVTGYPTG